MSDKFDDMAKEWLTNWGLFAIYPAEDLSSLLRRIASEAKAEQREVDAEMVDDYLREEAASDKSVGIFPAPQETLDLLSELTVAIRNQPLSKGKDEK